MTCGVRQGGVLSPMLFAIYVDDIVTLYAPPSLAVLLVTCMWVVSCMQTT